MPAVSFYCCGVARHCTEARIFFILDPEESGRAELRDRWSPWSCRVMKTCKAFTSSHSLSFSLSLTLSLFRLLGFSSFSLCLYLSFSLSLCQSWLSDFVDSFELPLEVP